MTSQLQHTWSVGTLFGMVGERTVLTITWYHFYECGVLNNEFPEGVIVTPLGKIFSKKYLGRTRVKGLLYNFGKKRLRFFLMEITFWLHLRMSALRG